MEQQFGELQAALGDKDAQIAAYEQDFNAMNEHSSVSWRCGLLKRMRRWGGQVCRGMPNPAAALCLRR
jgi:hypothetical protein